VRYATAAVFGYFCKTGELVFTNAGHPEALGITQPRKDGIGCTTKRLTGRPRWKGSRLG
jgi:hypothetical protein